MAIEPDLAVPVDAIEFDPNVPALPFGRSGEFFSIPADPGRKKTAAACG